MELYCLQSDYIAAKLRVIASLAGVALSFTCPTTKEKMTSISTEASGLALVQPDGSVLTEQTAIIAALCASCADVHLCSGAAMDAIDESCSILETPLQALLAVTSGDPSFAMSPEDAAKASAVAQDEIKAALTTLDGTLTEGTFLVGERMSAAGNEAP